MAVTLLGSQSTTAILPSLYVLLPTVPASQPIFYYPNFTTHYLLQSILGSNGPI